VNFLGHTHVALALGHEDPAFLLGVALPDLASMARVGLDRSELDGLLAKGVRCHITTDAVFHSDPAFRRGATAIRTELADRGLSRGAARAAGHVGWELLLDGTLVGSSTERTFWDAMGAGDAAVPAIAPPHRERWLRFLARWHVRPTPTLRYDEPDWVAERIHQMLAIRPRLRFPAGQRALVAQTLRHHAPMVTEVAEEVLARSAVRRS
jgi:hypothetical protein